MAFVHRFVPSLSPLYIQAVIGLSVLAAATGAVTTTLLVQPSRRLWRGTSYRWAEVMLLLLLTRLVIWLIADRWPSLMTMVTQPVGTLFDGYFVAGAVSVLMAWLYATNMSGDLLDMALQPDELYQLEHSGDHYRDSMRAAFTDRSMLLRSFVARWVIGGILLVILAAGLSYARPEQGLFALARQNIAPTIIAAIVIYFLAGLVLISQGQLAVLRARWTLERIPSNHHILRNWPLYVSAVILAVGFAAALMPFGGTFRLSQILTTAIALIYLVAYTVYRLLAYLFFLLLSLLPGGDQPPPPPEMPPIQPLPPPEAPSPPPEMLAYAGGTLFWIVTALLLGYAAYIYFSGRGLSLSWLAWLLQTIRQRWLSMWGAYQEWQTHRLRTIAGRDQDERQSGGRGFWSRFRRQKLDAAGQVRYLYLTLLERAEQAGIARARSETPIQYAPRLTAALIEDEGDPAKEGEKAVRSLTDAFIEVRYAAGSAREMDLSWLERLWQRVTTALRSR